jgi:tetratricopeptide (TPR) repeat protein
MKTERRHELHSNWLADFLDDFSENVRPYSNVILGLTIAVLVVLGTYFYLSKRAQADEADSWDKTWHALSRDNFQAMIEDLRATSEAYRDKPAGMWSQLVLADVELDNGVTTLFLEKSVGNNQIHSALESYQSVAERATQPLLREHALYGVGRSQESLDQLDKAREAYEQLLKDYPQGPYAARAKQRVDRLARDSSKSFYDWFETTEPAPNVFGKGSGASGGTNPSVPGLTLPPEFSLPDIGSAKTPPGEPKPDQPKSKPEEPKSDGVKPDTGKSGAAKPDAAKPETPKADSPKAATDKAGAAK